MKSFLTRKMVERRRRRVRQCAIDMLEERTLFTSFYVNSAAAAGGAGTAALPWNALASVSAYTGFHSGDVVNLTGTFSNQVLTLGSAATGITVTSSATNPAKIVESASYAFTSAIEVTCAGVTLSNLQLTGPGVSANSNSYYGIWFDNAGTTQLTGATVNNVNETGFVFAGLEMLGGSKGFTNASITNSNFSNNQVSGIVVEGSTSVYSHSNLLISNCSTSYNAGVAIYYDAHHTGANQNSANGGIYISSISKGVVDHCRAFGNSYEASGAAGILAYNATGIVFQYSESADTQTTAPNADGEGFDFDHGVSDSIMQYDYSHGNAGSGFFLCTYGGTVTNASDTIRYCISDDDATAGGAGIMIYGFSMNLMPHPVVGANIYNNTVLAGPGSNGAVCITGITPVAGSYCSANFLANLFYCTNGDAVVYCPFYTPALSNVTFEGNDYWTTGGQSNFITDWGGATYFALTDWVAASGEEEMGATVAGLNADPALVNETVGDLPISSISNLQLSLYSPLRGAGLDVTAGALVNTAPYDLYSPYNLAGTAWNGSGGSDYFGNAVIHGGGHDIGANQVSTLILNGSAAGNTITLTADPNIAATLDVNGVARSLQGISSVVFNGSTGNESLTYDYVNGPLTNTNGAPVSLTFNAGTAANTFNSINTGWGSSGGSAMIFDPGASHSNTINASAGTVTIASGVQTGINAAWFFSILISAGAEVSVADTSIDPANRTLLVVSNSLTLANSSSGTWTGTLNLANNDLDLKNAGLSAVASEIAQGFASNSPATGGIISSAAASGSNITTLGAIQNTVNGTGPGTVLYSSVDSTAALSTDVLVKFTYYGDANLDGKVDGSDYSLIDNGYLNHLTGWFNGDFNSDGVVDGSDYTLIDNAFNMQGASLAAMVVPSAQPGARRQSDSVFAVALPQSESTPEGTAEFRKYPATKITEDVLDRLDIQKSA